MSKKQISSMIILGVFITIGILVANSCLDSYISNIVPISTLNEETELVTYLNKAQNLERIYIGLHGYEHKCSICKSTDHELTCLSGHVPVEEIRNRIDNGLKICNQSGLKSSWYAFPGMAYDQRALTILKSYGYATMKYQVNNWKELDLVIDSSIINFTSKFQIKEYTWMWRKPVSEAQFNDTLRELDKDKPVQILIHVQDLTLQTQDFLEYAVIQAGTTIIRCDDIVSNNDLQKTKQLVEFADDHNIHLLLAVIPTFKRTIQTFPLRLLLTTSWILFVGFFVFPHAVMVPWAIIYKLKRKKPPLIGNPHYPTISLIFPVYNEEKIIARSIEQGLKQYYDGKKEIIIVDDGSTDKTAEIAERFVAEHNNVQVVRHVNNLGKAYALNTGFAKARGEISIFSDGDSILASDFISKVVPHFNDPEVGMVSGMIVVQNEKNLLTRLQQIEYSFSQLIVRLCQSSHRNVLISPGAASAVRTKIAQEIPSTCRTITEDADFTFAVWEKGWKIAQEPEAISYTEAPEKFMDLINQRKRWYYGGLQTMALHKWTVRKGNLWVIWSWLSHILCPFSLLSFFAIPFIYILLASNFPIFIIANILMTYLLVTGIYSISRIIGMKLLKITQTRSLSLTLLMPLYVFYEMVLNSLLVYLVFAFTSRRGIKLKRGGKVVHAI